MFAELLVVLVNLLTLSLLWHYDGILSSISKTTDRLKIHDVNFCLLIIYLIYYHYFYRKLVFLLTKSSIIISNKTSSEQTHRKRWKLRKKVSSSSVIWRQQTIGKQQEPTFEDIAWERLWGLIMLTDLQVRNRRPRFDFQFCLSYVVKRSSSSS